MAAPPIIPTLPAAPNRNDAPVDFSVKADAFVAALPPMVAKENELAAWMNENAAGAAASATASANSATASADSATSAATQVTLAADQVELAAAQVGLATTQANSAAASANSAQVSAAAAGAAAGLPALTGNAGKALTVKLDETGVEFTALGQAIGDTLFTARNPGSTYIKGANTYLQSSYPELFSVLGLLTDGPQITSRALPGSGLTFVIAYGNGVFVIAALQFSAVCYSSVDGINWTSRALGSSGTWVSLSFVNNKFVMTAGGNASANILTSPDGITWTPAGLTPFLATRAPISYGAGLYVIMRDAGLVYTSPDLSTWTSRTFPLNSGTGWGSLTFAAGVFVAVAGTGQVNTSVDGISWTYRLTLANRGWEGIAYGNGIFMLIAHEYAARSADGTTWEQLPQNTQLAGSSAVTFGAGVFATAGSTPPSTSKDGYFWVSRGATGFSAPSVAYGASLFVVVGASFGGSATFPFASYDTATLFYVPSLLRAQQGFTEYVKAKEA